MVTKRNGVYLGVTLALVTIGLCAEQVDKSLNSYLVCPTLGKTGIFDSMQFQWVYQDFNRSMQAAQFSNAIALTKQIVGLDGLELFIFFKKLYEKNNLSKIQPAQELKIPKIIHMVWLGSPLPETFQKYIDSWVEKHVGRDWQFKLWTDEDVKTFPLINQKFYDATDNYGVKSDLLKWEIVYRYGGVYVDVDFECYQPLDVLHYTYDFYTGIQPLDTQYLQLGAALFGACPGHPILKHCIDSIKDDWEKKGAPAKSGPIHFTKSFCATAGKSELIDIAFPASYLYPLGCRETVLKKDEWVAQGAIANHHWAKSWMPKEYRTKEFRNLDNDHLVKTWNQ